MLAGADKKIYQYKCCRCRKIISIEGSRDIHKDMGWIYSYGYYCPECQKESDFQYEKKSIQNVVDKLEKAKELLMEAELIAGDIPGTEMEKLLYQEAARKIRMDIINPLIDIQFFTQRILDAERNEK